jgi:hypothetical protein
MALITNEETGTRKLEQNIAANTERNQKTFEVLDYDSFGNNYALIYKSVEIVHLQTFKQKIIGSGNGGYHQPGWGTLDMVCPLTLTATSEETSAASRIVTYKLHCKIVSIVDGKEVITLVKKDLTTCSIVANDSIQTLSGDRIYAPSIQVTDKFITYSYEYDIMQSRQPNVNAARYDGAINLEDWNYDVLNQLIWQRTKHIVGLININDGSGSDVGHDGTREYATTGEAINQVPFPSQQYSVGEAGI